MFMLSTRYHIEKFSTFDVSPGILLSFAAACSCVVAKISKRIMFSLLLNVSTILQSQSHLQLAVGSDVHAAAPSITSIRSVNFIGVLIKAALVQVGFPKR